MRVRVLFFGVLKDLAGKASETIELSDGMSVRAMVAHCSSAKPELQKHFQSLAVAVNQQYASPDTTLNDGDEVALLPPVSGGAPTAGGVSAGFRARVEIVRAKIDTAKILHEMKRGEDGAAIVFEGTVRNNTRGRKTLFLDYEAYEEMALQQMESLAGQVLQQFQVRDVAIIHRLGRLEIGETSVLIAVASAHRAAAFDACRWLIDTLKKTVPIWKKEHFEDGAVWADGEPFPVDIPRANS